jgi:hypothetical protein
MMAKEQGAVVEAGWLADQFRSATEEISKWPEWVKRAAEFEDKHLDGRPIQKSIAEHLDAAPQKSTKK